MANRFFIIKLEDEYSDLIPIAAGIPQGSILGPIFYLLQTSDVPKSSGFFTATFADDTALLATGKSVEESSAVLQEVINIVNAWTKKWRIESNRYMGS